MTRRWPRAIRAPLVFLCLGMAVELGFRNEPTELILQLVSADGTKAILSTVWAGSPEGVWSEGRDWLWEEGGGTNLLPRKGPLPFKSLRLAFLREYAMILRCPGGVLTLRDATWHGLTRLGPDAEEFGGRTVRIVDADGQYAIHLDDAVIDLPPWPELAPGRTTHKAVYRAGNTPYILEIPFLASNPPHPYRLFTLDSSGVRLVASRECVDVDEVEDGLCLRERPDRRVCWDEETRPHELDPRALFALTTRVGYRVADLGDRDATLEPGLLTVDGSRGGHDPFIPVVLAPDRVRLFWDDGYEDVTYDGISPLREY